MYTRKRTRLSARIQEISKIVPIKNAFPIFASTNATTKVAVEHRSVTQTNGFGIIGSLKGGSIADPFGDLDVIDATGDVDADSFFETSGHDELGKIYSAYRVVSSSILFTIRAKNAIDDSATFIDIDGTTGSTSGRYVQQKPLMVCIIPSTQSTVPAGTWGEAIHHPFSYTKKIPVGDALRSGGKVSLRVSIANHASFFMALFRNQNNQIGEAITWTDWTSDPAAGQMVFYHILILDQTGANDDVVNFSYEVTMRQQIYMSKVGSTDTGIALAIKDDLEPTTTA